MKLEKMYIRKRWSLKWLIIGRARKLGIKAFLRGKKNPDFKKNWKSLREITLT